MDAFIQFAQENYRARTAYVLIMAVRRLHDIAVDDDDEKDRRDYRDLTCLATEQGYRRIETFLVETSGGTRRSYCRAVIMALEFVELDDGTRKEVKEKYRCLAREDTRLKLEALHSLPPRPPSPPSSRFFSLLKTMRAFVCNWVCAWDG